MAIITISRELAALGDESAKELAKLLSCRFVDKYALEEQMKNFDRSGETLKKYDERKPSLFASISEERDDYLHFLKSAILAEAKTGNCIFIGRGAFAVLEGVPGVLPVFLVSSNNIRIERVKSYFRCDRKRAAQIITQSDRDRAGFHQYFFEKSWKDPENYVLTLNTSVLHPLACAEIIKDMAGTLCPRNVEAACSQKLAEMTLARNVVHHIHYERQIGVRFLEARITNKSVELYGVANSAMMVDAAKAAALEVPGIEDAASDIQVVQEWAAHPYS